MELEFETEKDLYNRIKPALTTKMNDMRRNGFNYIKIEDIWNFLKETKWKNTTNLALHQMVTDVINAHNNDVEDYVKEKLNKNDRKIYFND